MEDIHREFDSKSPQMRREGDSVDDFEHLGHDSSPLGHANPPVGDLLDMQCSEPAKIDTGSENTGLAFTGVSFQPSKTVEDPLSQKMDSNLLEMGDAVPQNARQPAPEPKLDDFMHGEDFLPRDHLQDRQNILKTFMENERQVMEDIEKLHSKNPDRDLLDKYSDSDDDEFVLTPISAPTSAPPPVPSYVPAAPAPVKEKTPEPPVKEKTPEPPAKPASAPVEPPQKEAPQKGLEVKAKIAPADAEAIFKKMGLGKARG
ncbi:unnamed protein product [Acanthoscelides obtectus]|uniref:Uncharacterized protein n=1 Tax=Acanthoscelides obtectus TaxID=200917 RepID=A0A9P0JTD1_ACAOB|nr:unnamed protein product [Acanthoscelides obtectus]CAK1637428.1 hypothetical protein AOBTE_LOCUS9970 [Acanthoscelides obtectus]